MTCGGSRAGTALAMSWHPQPPRPRHVDRERRETDQGPQGRIRRPALRRHARRAAPRHLPQVDRRRLAVRGRQDVRRLLDQRLARHPELGHGAVARSVHRVPRSVHRGPDAGADLRHPRPDHDAGLHPRSARRGQARRGHLKASGIADQAFFGPEPEFFILDSVRFANEMGHVFHQVDSEEAHWNSGATTKAATAATGRW